MIIVTQNAMSEPLCDFERKLKTAVTFIGENKVEEAKIIINEVVFGCRLLSDFLDGCRFGTTSDEKEEVEV